jgi:hypothetical protein
MQAVHELGHVLAAWATGGRVAKVQLHPLAISYTLLSANPSPLVVAWMGPIFGDIIPLVAWLIARRLRLRCAFLLQFFAGFCCVANGGYLVGGSVYEMGDARDLLQSGASRWQLFGFGFVFVAIGLYCWNGLGRYFGFGELAEKVDSKIAIAVTLIAVLAIGLELLLG